MTFIIIDLVAGDNVVNATEHQVSVSIGGTVVDPAFDPVKIDITGPGNFALTLYSAIDFQTGAWSVLLDANTVAGLADGTFCITASAANSSSNPIDASTSFHVFTTPPTLAIDPIATDNVIDAIEHNQALTVSDTGADGRIVQVGFGTHDYTGTLTAGTWSVTIPQSVAAGLGDRPDGSTADVTDAYGNAATAAPRTLTVDTIASAAPTLHLVAGGTSVLTGTAEPGARVGIAIDSHSTGIATAGQDGALTYILPAPVPDGEHTATAIQTDAAGNVSAGSTPVELSRAASDFVTTDPDFDAAYYLAHNPDVAASGMDPFQHYQEFGWHEGRNPDAFFNVQFYLNQNPDVAAAGIDPLEHYEINGWKEGRDPSALFSTNDYLASNPDVAAAGFDPLAHYLHYGQAEARMAFITAPHALGPQDPLVDAAYFYAHNPAAAAAGLDATAAFYTSGWQQGANPNAFFDVSYYLSRNPDVAAAGVNPLLHYENFGWREGRDPSAAFSTSGYLTANPDVAAAGFDPLEHFIVAGQAEGRSVIPV